jgi:hypothetical protein
MRALHRCQAAARTSADDRGGGRQRDQGLAEQLRDLQAAPGGSRHPVNKIDASAM